MKSYRTFTVLLLVLNAITANAAPSRQAQSQLEKMREQGREEKWTFTTGYSPVMERTLAESTGLVRPTDWNKKAMFVTLKPKLQGAMPAQFDWRQQSQGLPPIKDQKSCGSCWAFATVGVFESVLKIREWKTKSFSEQYLISCNDEGYGCSGGWWAHRYHQSPGAVMSSAFPYAAADVQCRASLAHGDQVMSWAYVAGSGGTESTPEVDQIKQAIMDYGPVSVGVYADSRFKAYKGGVFNACNGQSEPNHAVVLIGWDDNTNTWIMRNSWGTKWGEKGYMHIKYGCNGIGQGASYVVYKARCAPNADAGQDVVVHAGQSVRIGSKAIPGQTYHWTPEEGLDDPNLATPIATPKGDTIYTVTADTDCGTAEHRATVSVN